MQPYYIASAVQVHTIVTMLVRLFSVVIEKTYPED